MMIVKIIALENFNICFYRKSSGVFVGLFLAIVIPCVVAYLAVIDLIVIYSKKPTPPNNMETSQINFAQKQYNNFITIFKNKSLFIFLWFIKKIILKNNYFFSKKIN